MIGNTKPNADYTHNLALYLLALGVIQSNGKTLLNRETMQAVEALQKQLELE